MKIAAMCCVLLALQSTMVFADRPERRLLQSGPAPGPAQSNTDAFGPASAPVPSISQSTSVDQNTNSISSSPKPEGSAAVYSNSSTVPAVTSKAKLASYANVDAFSSTEQTRFITTLEANILQSFGAVSNVTIQTVTPGSIVVANTIAFTGADAAAATSAQSSLIDALNSQDGVSSVFGDSFGVVEVSSVAKTTAANPTADSSGVSSAGLSMMILSAGFVSTLLLMAF